MRTTIFTLLFIMTMFTVLAVGWTDIGASERHYYQSSAEGKVDTLIYNLYNVTLNTTYLKMETLPRLGDATGKWGQELQVDDVTSSHSGLEIVVAERDSVTNESLIEVFSANNITLITQYVFDYAVFENVGILYDWDDDGYSDYVVVTQDNSSYYLSVVSLDGTPSLIEHLVITHDADRKIPSCYLDFCYLIDNSQNLHRWNITDGSGSEISLNTDIDTQDNHWMNIGLIDQSGTLGLITTTYEDITNQVHMHVVELDTFTELCDYDTGKNVYVYRPPTIANPVYEGSAETKTYMWFHGNRFGVYGGNIVGNSYYTGAVSFNHSTQTCDNLVTMEEGACTWDYLNSENSCYVWSGAFAFNNFDGTSSPTWNGNEYEVCYVTNRDCATNNQDCTGVDFGTGYRFVCYDNADFFAYEEITSFATNMGIAVPLANMDNSSSGLVEAEDYDLIAEASVTNPSWSGGKVYGDNGRIYDQSGTGLTTDLSGYAGAKIPIQESTYADIVFLSDDNYLFIYTDDINDTLVNQLPTISLFLGVPNPAEVLEEVEYTFNLGDNEGDQIYFAFDCEDDGTLEQNFTATGSGASSYNCTYATIGSKTARLTVTDSVGVDNVTSTEDVTIASATVSNCTGFVAPTCTGTCWFNDDFNYNSTIDCNGWSGVAISPENGSLHLTDVGVGDIVILDKRSEPIYSYEYNGFDFQFDFMSNDTFRVYMYLYDEDVNKAITHLYWDSNVLYSMDNVYPYTNNLGTFDNLTSYTVSGSVNFENQEVTLQFDNTTITKEFLDTDVESMGYIVIDWLYDSSVDFYIDNFQISYGATANGTAPTDTTESPSYLDTGNFCAIDWDTNDFLEDECETRGYSTRYQFTQVCLVRACMTDITVMMFVTAQKNIYKTLIVIFAIVLLAPLLIALLGKMRR